MLTVLQFVLILAKLTEAYDIPWWQILLPVEYLATLSLIRLVLIFLKYKEV
jgi:hypothetical protein